MSLPEDVLSTEIVPAIYTGPRSLPVTELIDYEHGGIGIQDTTRGLTYQTWRARAVSGSILLSAPTVEEFVFYAGAGQVTEVSLAFDQNMRPAIAFVEDNLCKFSWYDTTASEQVITTLPGGCRTPRVTLDDKRSSQAGVSDIILAYMRGRNLYYRRQRDRYGVELDPTQDLPEPERTEQRALIASAKGLIKIGINRQLRMQFMFSYPDGVQ